jgi:hypothetical protein
VQGPSATNSFVPRTEETVFPINGCILLLNLPNKKKTKTSLVRPVLNPNCAPCWPLLCPTAG